MYLVAKRLNSAGLRFPINAPSLKMLTLRKDEADLHWLHKHLASIDDVNDIKGPKSVNVFWSLVAISRHSFDWRNLIERRWFQLAFANQSSCYRNSIGKNLKSAITLRLDSTEVRKICLIRGVYLGEKQWGCACQDKMLWPCPGIKC